MLNALQLYNNRLQIWLSKQLFGLAESLVKFIAKYVHGNIPSTRLEKINQICGNDLSVGISQKHYTVEGYNEDKASLHYSALTIYFIRIVCRQETLPNDIKKTDTEALISVDLHLTRRSHQIGT